jgi:hypothetical protein
MFFSHLSGEGARGLGLVLLLLLLQRRSRDTAGTTVQDVRQVEAGEKELSDRVKIFWDQFRPKFTNET